MCVHLPVPSHSPGRNPLVKQHESSSMSPLPPLAPAPPLPRLRVRVCVPPCALACCRARLLLPLRHKIPSPPRRATLRRTLRRTRPRTRTRTRREERQRRRRLPQQQQHVQEQEQEQEQRQPQQQGQQQGQQPRHARRPTAATATSAAAAAATTATATAAKDIVVSDRSACGWCAARDAATAAATGGIGEGSSVYVRLACLRGVTEGSARSVVQDSGATSKPHVGDYTYHSARAVRPTTGHK